MYKTGKMLYNYVCNKKTTQYKISLLIYVIISGSRSTASGLNKKH